MPEWLIGTVLNAPTLTSEPNPRDKASDASGQALTHVGVAEGVGFEPTDSLHYQRFSRPFPDSTKPGKAKSLRIATPPVSHPIPTDTCNNDPDLAAVNAAWPELPEGVKQSIVMLVKAASKGGGR